MEIAPYPSVEIRGPPETVPVFVPVPETRMLISFFCGNESGAGTGLQPRHGHESSMETAEPLV
jgi:hypothetical protein